MQRILQLPRPNWREKVEALGFDYHTIEGQLYWDESIAYEFTANEVDALEEASQCLEKACLEAVDHIIAKKRYADLGISAALIPLIEASWRNHHKNLYGRFDLTFDKQGVPKLLEYNADTPTALLEAAVIQWEWLQDVKPEMDQFNSIHEKLVEAWKNFSLSSSSLYFSGILDNGEDLGTLNYLRDTALQAGLQAPLIDIRDIGWNGHQFVDLDHQEIYTLFKLYPWEWMVKEDFIHLIMSSQTLMIEPAWKSLLSNKAILVVLWELFPDHPHLLPASFTPSSALGQWIKKPLFSREGANILISDEEVQTDGPYGSEGFIYQQYCPLKNFDGHYPVIGSWMIASQPAGIGIREDNYPITTNASRFIPHYFIPSE